MKRAWLFAVALGACGDNVTIDSHCDEWRQWGGNASHEAASCVEGQSLDRVLADVEFDPYTAEEIEDWNGNLPIHYQVPLIAGDELYMLQKGGAYTRCNFDQGHRDCTAGGQAHRLESQVWQERAYTIEASGALTERWTFVSDWLPLSQANEWVFQPAITDDLLIVPGANGSIWEVSRASGDVVRHVEPFPDSAGSDHPIVVAGGITVGPTGTIYYNARETPFVYYGSSGTPAPEGQRGFLVVVHADGDTEVRDYADIVPDAPADCYTSYYDMDPVPAGPFPLLDERGQVILPPLRRCGPQVPGLSSAPTLGADGTLFLVSHAYFNERYSYVIALGRDLKTRWATSLRDLVHDACGVLYSFACTPGAPVGVEADTGLAPGLLVTDGSSGSPVALPDGGVLYGSLSYYNESRGHLLKLTADGEVVNTYDFGWDMTPAVFVQPDGDYRLLLKDNHYFQMQQGLWDYFLTSLDSSLQPLWQLPSTEESSCIRGDDGAVTCSVDHPHGFEWCISTPAVDASGTLYANSEDGNLYAVGTDGVMKQRIFMDRALGASYTPVALDGQGRVISQNSGHLFVIGR